MSRFRDTIQDVRQGNSDRRGERLAYCGRGRYPFQKGEAAEPGFRDEDPSPIGPGQRTVRITKENIHDQWDWLHPLGPE